MPGNDQKIENLLNLALDATQEERQKSENLGTGYNEEERTWQVIVRYTGTLPGSDPDSAYANWETVTLSGGYAIVTLPRGDVELLASLAQVIYIEKPKRMYFETDIGRTASCISAVQIPQFNLTGRGILVGVIDSGVDYFHPDFRDDNGDTRILAMWDQTGGETGVSSDSLPHMGRIPVGFASGTEYTREEINAALNTGNREAGYALVPERDVSGHGTQVLGIAAGNGRSSGGRYRGIAPDSDLIVVKLGMPREKGFPLTAELMQALEYIIRKAEEIGRPVAVNISIGNVYGSHQGTSLLETYIDMMADHGRNVITVGVGNEGNTGGHVSGQLQGSTGNSLSEKFRNGRAVGAGEPVPGQSGGRTVAGSGDSARGLQTIEFLINDYESALDIQIWKDYTDEFQVTVVHPDGRRAEVAGRAAGTSRYRIGNTELLVYYGEPSPYQGRQEIYLGFLPADTYLDSGIWGIILTPVRIVSGEYQMWMSEGRARGSGTRFLQPSPDTTMTIPSTAANVIAVGAYDARSNSYASFSGRGWSGHLFQPKPDLTAPGVAVTTTAVGGGYVSVSGTSFAAPFVTGAAALLMQWGIVDGNDPYLYGEKVRAYLRRGARQLPGFVQYPNNQVGYGALCVRESLPE